MSDWGTIIDDNKNSTYKVKLDGQENCYSVVPAIGGLCSIGQRLPVGFGDNDSQKPVVIADRKHIGKKRQSNPYIPIPTSTTLWCQGYRDPGWSRYNSTTYATNNSIYREFDLGKTGTYKHTVYYGSDTKSLVVRIVNNKEYVMALVRCSDTQLKGVCFNIADNLKVWESNAFTLVPTITDYTYIEDPRFYLYENKAYFVQIFYYSGSYQTKYYSWAHVVDGVQISKNYYGTREDDKYLLKIRVTVIDFLTGAITENYYDKIVMGDYINTGGRYKQINAAPFVNEYYLDFYGKRVIIGDKKFLLCLYYCSLFSGAQPNWDGTFSSFATMSNLLGFKNNKIYIRINYGGTICDLNNDTLVMQDVHDPQNLEYIWNSLPVNAQAYYGTAIMELDLDSGSDTINWLKGDVDICNLVTQMDDSIYGVSASKFTSGLRYRQTLEIGGDPDGWVLLVPFLLENPGNSYISYPGLFRFGTDGTWKWNQPSVTTSVFRIYNGKIYVYMSSKWYEYDANSGSLLRIINVSSSTATIREDNGVVTMIAGYDYSDTKNCYSSIYNTMLSDTLGSLPLRGTFFALGNYVYTSGAKYYSEYGEYRNTIRALGVR